ncbi:hypothetical protein QJQ45_003642 [Haematococcus lacustris]|nr:hypothetical protein QJQ45_003642 [Haematococcus lacustris]
MLSVAATPEARSGRLAAFGAPQHTRPVNAMVTKKRGVMARCAGAQKAREVMAQRRAAEAEAKAQAGAAEAEAKAQAGVAEAQALAQADAGADEAGADEAGADEADAGAYEAEAQAQADAGAYEAQLHQLQPELQQREQQATDTQRLQHLQQQLQDLLQEELQRKEQQVAEQQQQLQQQQADMHLREQQLAEQQHQLQQQQANMQHREQQVAQQQQQVQQQQADLQQREQQRKLDNGQGVELATVHTTLGELVLGFNARMQKQLWHQYLAKHQRATFRAHCAAVRNTPGLVVVSCDWSEKLTIHQDIACQGAYWKQRTMSVFVACAHYQDMAGNYREESVFVSADRCDQSAEASTTALVQVIECLLQGRRHPDGIQGEASNTDGVSEGRDDGEGWVGKMDMRQLCLWSDGCASQFKGAKAIKLHWHLANSAVVPQMLPAPGLLMLLSGVVAAVTAAWNSQLRLYETATANNTCRCGGFVDSVGAAEEGEEALAVD